MEELIDILDENGNKTGKIKLRSEVHRDGDWHKGDKCIITNSNFWKYSFRLKCRW